VDGRNIYIYSSAVISPHVTYEELLKVIHHRTSNTHIFYSECLWFEVFECRMSSRGGDLEVDDSLFANRF